MGKWVTKWSVVVLPSLSIEGLKVVAQAPLFWVDLRKERIFWAVKAVNGIVPLWEKLLLLMWIH